MEEKKKEQSPTTDERSKKFTALPNLQLEESSP